jgi:hypothetical protein
MSVSDLETPHRKTYSHIIYIDESGNAGRSDDIKKYWTVAAVCVGLDKQNEMDEEISKIISEFYRLSVKELKGADTPRNFKPGISVEDFSKSFSSMIKELDINVWVAASKYGVKAPKTMILDKPHPKNLVRHLLFERLNGFFIHGHNGTDNCLIVWDISDLQELQDFSSSVSMFRNSISNETLCNRIAPAVLGGLSHEWSGLQVADIIANFALHKLGVDENMPDANTNKGKAFDTYLMPLLQKDGYGKRVGWKYFK